MKCWITRDELAQRLIPRPADAHKGIMGHALLVAGSYGMMGCAVLAGKACMCSGIGKLSILAPRAGHEVLQTALPEAILQLHGEEVSQSWDTVSADMQHFQSVGIGPGIRLSAALLVEDLLTASGELPLVIDADALTLLASHLAWYSLLKGRTVLTPHLGELNRLRAGICLDDAESPVSVALHIAKTYEVVVIVKGHPSQVVLPQGDVWVCQEGNPGMATAGSGDVLTGIITGLLAQGYDMASAAMLGVWIHATAGDVAAARWGQEYMLARHIIACMPQAWRRLHRS